MKLISSRRAMPFFGLTLAVAVAALLLLHPSRDLQAQESPTVRISPATQTVAAGSEITVDIIIENAPSFAAYEFHLAYELPVLNFVSVTGGGDILESAGRDAFCFGPDAADLADGIISYACGSTGGGSGPSGDGVLATLTFATSCTGNSDLAFVSVGKDLTVDAVSMSDVLGASIPTQAVGGDVRVNGGDACPEPAQLPGDANCNETINSIDAAIVLQFNAGLLSALSCEENADANQNGSIDSIDAALILQFVAGLISNLPP